MKLTVLGSGSCIPAPNRGNPGYLLETDGRLILLDGGAGAIRNIPDSGADYRQVSHICYTHLHPDHTFDFVPLQFALKNDPDLRKPHHLRILAPKGFLEYWRRVHAIYSRWIDDDEISLEITEHESGEESDLGFVKITTGPVVHTDHSIAFRFEDREGNVFVYSGDTGYSEEFISFASDADLLLLESAIPERAEFESHLTPSQAGKLASIAGARRTVLTHFYPQVEREDDIRAIVKGVYSGEVSLARDGETYQISGDRR